MKLKTRNKVLIFVIILLLIVLLLMFLIPVNKKKTASPSFLYHVDYAPSNSVVIKNILPVADSLGKTFDGSGTKEGVQGYTEITISNTDKVNHEYYILIDKQDSDSEINGYYVKFYLTDSNDSPIDGFTSNLAPVYDDLLISKNKPSSRILGKVAVNAGDKKTFKIKSWLADNYVVSLKEEQFKYMVDVIEEY